MNRTVVSGLAAFALLIGAAVVMSETAEAGHHGGGLFSRLHAKQCGGGCDQPSCGGYAVQKSCGGGGLFARLKAKHAAPCCAAEPVCCESAPVCAPAPVCCEPAPVCAPEPTCCSAPTCGHKKRCGLFSKLRNRKSSCGCAAEPTCCDAAPMVEAPCCGGEVAPAAYAAPAAPCCGGSGEAAPVAIESSQGYDLAPGETLVPGSVSTGAAAAAAPAPEAAPAPAPAPESSSDAPPAPKADANTDI